MLKPYNDAAPEKDTLENTSGPMILEFGSNSCGICQAATPLLEAALGESGITHVRVQDGKGKRLGRQYGVKLWPTLIFMQDGQEVTRVVRPTVLRELEDALKKIQA